MKQKPSNIDNLIVFTDLQNHKLWQFFFFVSITSLLTNQLID